MPHDTIYFIIGHAADLQIPYVFDGEDMVSFNSGVAGLAAEGRDFPSYEAAAEAIKAERAAGSEWSYLILPWPADEIEIERTAAAVKSALTAEVDAEPLAPAPPLNPEGDLCGAAHPQFSSCKCTLPKGHSGKHVRVCADGSGRDIWGAEPTPAPPLDPFDPIVAEHPVREFRSQAGHVIGRVDFEEKRPTIFEEVIAEVERATLKFPTWPNDALHALAVVAEEMGELQKEALQLCYEPHKCRPGDFRKEAVQLAAMSLRFLASCDCYVTLPSPDHSQGNIATA